MYISRKCLYFPCRTEIWATYGCLRKGYIGQLAATHVHTACAQVQDLILTDPVQFTTDCDRVKVKSNLNNPSLTPPEILKGSLATGLVLTKRTIFAQEEHTLVFEQETGSDQGTPIVQVDLQKVPTLGECDSASDVSPPYVVACVTEPYLQITIAFPTELPADTVYAYSLHYLLD